MISLSPADLTRVKQTTDSAYPTFSPELRQVFNAQLLESRSYGEYLDWLERVELTRKFYAGEGVAMKVARPRKTNAGAARP